MSAIGRDEVTDFLQCYRAAFDTLDGGAVADLWHVPSAIASSHAADANAEVTGWHDDTPLRGSMRALCALYRSGGGARATRGVQGLPMLLCIAPEEDLGAMQGAAP